MWFSIIVLSLILVYSSVILFKAFKKKASGQCCNTKKENSFLKVPIQQMDKKKK